MAENARAVDHQRYSCVGFARDGQKGAARGGRSIARGSGCPSRGKTAQGDDAQGDDV